MENNITITSAANSRVKQLRKYYEAAKHRAADGVYVIEGLKLFYEADREAVKAVFVSEALIKKQPDILKYLEGFSYFVLREDDFNRTVRTNSPQGIAAVIKKPHYDLSIIERGLCQNVIIGERIQDPGNIGTIIRTAAAAGFDALILDDRSADVYSPKAVSASMGGIFRLPVLYVNDIFDIIKRLNDMGYDSLACVLGATNRYDRYAYGDRTAVLVGNEGQGLSEGAVSLAKTAISIPMTGDMESLNVSVAAALMMYEIRKKYI